MCSKGVSDPEWLVSDLRSNQLLVGNWHSYPIQDHHDIRQDRRMRPQRRGKLCGSGSATSPAIHHRTWGPLVLVDYHTWLDSNHEFERPWFQVWSACQWSEHQFFEAWLLPMVEHKAVELGFSKAWEKRRHHIISYHIIESSSDRREGNARSGVSD